MGSFLRASMHHAVGLQQRLQEGRQEGRQEGLQEGGRLPRRMRRRARGLLLALALAVAAPAPGQAADERPSEIPYQTSDPVPVLSPAYRQSSHEVVLITDEALNPRLVTLDEGQLVAWISYSKAASTIVFEREVARSMVCHSLVNFSIQDDELRSAEIHTGEFASFCQLKPGRYNYRVIRSNPKASGAKSAARRLEGQIIVGNPD